MVEVARVKAWATNLCNLIQIELKNAKKELVAIGGTIWKNSEKLMNYDGYDYQCIISNRLSVRNLNPGKSVYLEAMLAIIIIANNIMNIKSQVAIFTE